MGLITSMGLDLSATCTGLVVIGEDIERGQTIQTPQHKGFARLQLIAAKVEDALEIWRPEVVIIENYAFFRNIDSFIRLVEVGTVIRSILSQRKVPWYTVNVKALKKWTTGNGNAKKPDMADAVKQRWGYQSPSDDIIDGYALAKMGQLPLSELLALKGVAAGV